MDTPNSAPTPIDFGVYTPEKLIARWFELKQKLDDLDEAYKKATGPLKNAQDTIEGALRIYMAQTGQKNVRTEDGLAYKAPWFSAKVSDPIAFLDWVFEHKAREFLTNHISKEPVKAHMAANNGRPPPGVSVDSGTNINIKR